MSSFKLILSLAVLFMIGCSEASTDTSSTTTAPDISVVPSPNTPAAAAPAAKPAEPAQNAEGVWHYTCANGCAGGGGSATACSSCGGTLAHNAAYHTPSAATPTIGGNNGSPLVVPPPGSGSPITTAPKAAEPAQNAAGVWHYTCAKGCAGGGGSATACGGCGGTLAHNAAYHQ